MQVVTVHSGADNMAEKETVISRRIAMPRLFLDFSTRLKAKILHAGAHSHPKRSSSISKG
jgi:hypothetical protein